MSGGMMPKRKGYEYERELVNGFRDHGLKCSRVPLSGAGEEKGDIRLTCGWGQNLKGEAKRRKTLPAYLNPGEHDFTIFRQDRGETLVLVRLSLFKDLVQ
jgi:Holliday junction resolvase